MYCCSIHFQCCCCKVLVMWYGMTVQSCSYIVALNINLFSRIFTDLFLYFLHHQSTLYINTFLLFFCENFYLTAYVPLLLALYTCAVRLVCKINIAF